MAESFKDKLQDAGDAISEKATQVGNRVGEAVEKGADWAKEKAHEVGNRVEEAGQHMGHKAKDLSQSTGATGSVADIKQHMDVYGSDGTRVGKVDHVQATQIKLTKNDSPDGQHHLIPTSWVAKVHDHVHLNKSATEVQQAWQPA